MRKILGALAFVAAGCSAVRVVDPLPESAEVGPFDGRVKPATRKIEGSALNFRYGVWIEKGPKILSRDGKPLLDARVTFQGEENAQGLEIAPDGCVILNRYMTNSGTPGYSRYPGAGGKLNVSCPGYHPRTVGIFFDNPPVQILDEIRLDPILGQAPCRTFNKIAVITGSANPVICGFDLVEGDWLPPFGWGKVEDLRVTVSANPNEKNTFTISSNGVKPYNRGGYDSSGPTAKIEFVRDGDGFGKDAVGCADCTNRVVFLLRHGDGLCRVFRTRGYYGRVDGVDISQDRNSYYSEEYDGKSRRNVRHEGPEVCTVTLRGCVNPEIGLTTFEPESVAPVPRPPTVRPVPKDGNRMAFGLSADERAAVCFGWAKEGARIPEIFEKGVYTANPAVDLPRVETLYLDMTPNYGRTSPVVTGLKELRTIVRLDDDMSRELGSRAFADNPKLDAFFFGRYGSDMIVAADTFAGASTNLTAVYSDGGMNVVRPWETMSVTNVFTRMVRYWRYDGGAIGPSIDARHGTVELPLVRVEEDFLEIEFSDGRIRRYRKDGSFENVFR